MSDYEETVDWLVELGVSRKAAEASLAWTRASVDREALQSVIAPLVAPYVSGPLDPLDVEIADAVLTHLAAPPAAPTAGVDRGALVAAGVRLATEHLGYADMGVRVLVERITDAALTVVAPVDADAVERAARVYTEHLAGRTYTDDEWNAVRSQTEVDAISAALAAARAGDLVPPAVPRRDGP